MDCPKCNSTDHIKQGYVGGRQRHKCKNCGYAYTVSERGKPMALKKFALQLYLEGNGFRAIGRVLKVSQVSVMNWIRTFGEMVDNVTELSTPAPIIEMDEIFTYIGEKKTSFGSGQPLTDLRKVLSGFKLGQEELALAISCIKK